MKIWGSRSVGLSGGGCEHEGFNLEVRKDAPEEIGADEDEVGGNQDEGFKLEVRKDAPEEIGAEDDEVEVDVQGVGLIVVKTRVAATIRGASPQVKILRRPFRPPPASFCVSEGPDTE